jgi:phosphoribosylcarboxyaminoimidazole (NCAIR) mutase
VGKKVAIVMGSQSDSPIAEKAEEIFKGSYSL